VNPIAHAAAVTLLLAAPAVAPAQEVPLASLVEQLDTDPAKVDYAGLWRAFRAEAELAPVLSAFEVLDPLGYPDGLSVESCRAQDTALSAALRVNPVSLALRHAALTCAELADDGVLAQRHEAVLAGLLAAAVGGGRGQSAMRPVAVTAEVDVVGFANAAGLKIDGAYYLPGTQPRFLPIHAQLSDPAAGTERDVDFDFFDVWLDLSRAEPESAFPIYAIGSARNYLEGAAEGGNVGARIALALRADRSTPQGREQATALLRGAIAAGSPTATLMLARACFTAPDLWSCDGQEIDGALELAEQGSGRALVLLAAAYTAGKGVKRDATTAGRLLEQAEKRLGVVTANEMLAELVAGRELRDDDLSRVGAQALRKAAAAGSPAAMRMLALAIDTDEVRAIEGEDPKALYARAAAGGDALASAVLAFHAIDGGDHAQAREHLQRAVDLGDGMAAGQLAAMHATGSGGPVDRAAANRLRVFAAWRGNPVSARMLAINHLPGGLDGIDFDRARRWLEGAAARGDVASLAIIAELDLEGHGSKPDLERARQVYGSLAAQGLDAGRLGAARVTIARGVDAAAMRAAARVIRSFARDDDHDAAREYARMLATGRGVKADLGEAITWYRGTMADSSRLSDDFVLGMLLLSGPDAQQDARRAREVFDRVVTKDRPSEINDIAWRLCVSRNDAFRDPPAGLALSLRVAEASMKAIDYSTRAACLAATGDFEKARATQDAGLQRLLVEDPDDARRVEAFHARLAFYRRDMPWRE
jgi:TPR repeat protein